MYICINEKRHRFLINPLWQKKNEMREHLLIIRQLGLSPFISHSTKLAGKLFFPTYCNYLVINIIIFELNR